MHLENKIKHSYNDSGDGRWERVISACRECVRKASWSCSEVAVGCWQHLGIYKIWAGGTKNIQARELQEGPEVGNHRTGI